ncbi:hypothetical protein HII31_10154 [Pseudocercospora fuligena]|uniref:Uncharacterized protein n=1 Tax=Pseudocercospora fuligena TaxID=685502 RepID=A0A8H6RD80_9PEZI|nr:hypothetical protein HII31_10154 [Pseudocercospora fuligena]
MDIVLDYVEDVDILALRATCRSVAGQAQDAFLNRYFSERRHLITEFSLRRLVDICKDDVLSSRLTSIEFVHVDLDFYWHPDVRCFTSRLGDAVDFMDWDDQMKWLHQAERNPQDETGEDDRHLANAMAQAQAEYAEALLQRKKEDAERLAVCDKWDALEDALGEDLIVNIIFLALKSLKDKSKPSIPALTVSTALQYPRRAFGLHELARYLGTDGRDDKPFGSRHSAGQKTTSMLLSGIAKANYPVRYLTLSTPSLPTLFANLNIGPQTLQLHSNMSQLRGLSMFFDRSIVSEYLNGFTTFLAAATSLEHIGIEFSTEYQNYIRNVPRAFADAFKNSKLKSIELATGRLERHDLVDLLATQQETLRRLRLVDMAPIDGNSWAPMLQTLQTDFDLEYIDIRLLTETRDRLCGAVHEGKAAVQEKLGELIKQANVLP